MSRREIGLAALAVALVGCGQRKLGPGVSPVDASPPRPDLDAAAEATVEAAAEATVETPAAPARIFADYVVQRETLRRARFVECFNGGAQSIMQERFFEEADRYDAELAAGLVAVDSANLAACLATIPNAPCADVAAGAIDAACAHVLVGRVPAGGICASAADCIGENQDCQQGHGPCSSRCGPGALPLPVAAEGERCDHVQCAAGLYCRYDGPQTFNGVCRAIAPGGACDGHWNCPWVYPCVFDDAGHGTCRVGRGVGEPCRLYAGDALNGPYDECGYDLRCYPDSNGELRCGEGAALGDSCGDFPLAGPGNDGFVPCKAGRCAGELSSLKCVPFAAEGGPCTDDWECDHAHLLCFQGRCRTRAAAYPIAADGEACGLPWGCGAASGCVGGICARCM